MNSAPTSDKRRVGQLLLAVVLLLLIGTAFYRWHEGLSWVDAVYLSGVTLATVGYGDVHPVTDLGKLFTVVYIFSGIGVIAVFAETLVHRAAESQADRQRRRNERKNGQT
jgi:voltage-gated potassium channel Kch